MDLLVALDVPLAEDDLVIDSILLALHDTPHRRRELATETCNAHTTTRPLEQTRRTLQSSIRTNARRTLQPHDDDTMRRRGATTVWLGQYGFVNKNAPWDSSFSLTAGKRTFAHSGGHPFARDPGHPEWQQRVPMEYSCDQTKAKNG